jgi:phosphoglycerate dehydrogenase-like enzyme
MAKPSTRPIVIQLNAYTPYRVWSLGSSVPTRLARSFPEVRVLQSRDRETFLRFLPEAQVLFTWTLPRRHFARARRLRWIHTPEGGVDSLLSPELIKSDVVVTNTRGLNSDCIADHALGLTLALTRRLADCREWQRQKIWARDFLWSGDRIPFPLRERTAVVVGMGPIGRAIAARLKACGMLVLGVRRKPSDKDEPGFDQVFATDQIDEALARADLLVLALPLTRGTRRYIDADRLEKLKPGAILINVGRGELIDERELIRALEHGRLGAVGLDVTEQEPLSKDSPLWTDPRVLISPHVAGTDPAHMERATELFEKNLELFLAGQPMQNVVDKRAGY